jgi:hypothetical protein
MEYLERGETSRRMVPVLKRHAFTENYTEISLEVSKEVKDATHKGVDGIKVAQNMHVGLDPINLRLT